jgi:outer membrane immunogenic protein
MRMRRLLLAGTALVFVGPVFAADMSAPRPAVMPIKAPVIAPMHFSWTGCYIGAQAGVGWGHKDISEPAEPFFQYFAPPDSPIGVDQSVGFIGGGQIGCDYQFAANWVVGARGDFSWAHIDGQASDPFFAGKDGGPITLTAKTNALASATGRLGYAWDRAMLYGIGGVAWAHDKYAIQDLSFWGAGLSQTFCANNAFTATQPCNPQGSETRLGWTVGVGLEWAFTDSWSILFEFNHYDFGTRSVTLTDPSGAGAGVLVPVSGTVDIKQRVEVVKIGINYRLGWGGSVSSRY